MFSLKELKEAIKESLGEDTCHYKFLWKDKSLPEFAGHCRIVSLVVNDYFKWEVLYSHVKGNKKWDHYWNIFPSEKEIDLTKDQFDKKIKLVKPQIVSRKEVLSSRRAQRGYKILTKKIRQNLI